MSHNNESLVIPNENKRPKVTFWEKIYFPEIIKGLNNTIKHLFKKKVTYQYPEKRKEIAPRYRGEHRLKKNELGQMKCVACYMCSTACPVGCIFIEATEAPADWIGREKIPKKFEIDMLRCIYCGFCVEACPKDAIEMTNKVPRVYYDRKDFIYDMDTLLNN
jgi:NADH-quinone oxidoreductase subunit I